MIYIKKNIYYLLYNIFLLFYSKTQVFSFDIVVKQQYIHTIDDLYKKILFTEQYIYYFLNNTFTFYSTIRLLFAEQYIYYFPGKIMGGPG